MIDVKKSESALFSEIRDKLHLQVGQFDEVTQFADGAIVGSAFLRAIENTPDVRWAARDFVKQFIG